MTSQPAQMTMAWDEESGTKPIVSFNVEEATAAHAGENEGVRASFQSKRGQRQSTMTLLTMDKSKSFYQKDYKKEHLGESREYW